MRGFTLIEVIIALTIASVVAAAIYGALYSQQRFYRKQRTITTTHDALRLASATLMTSLMEAASGDGDFSAIEPDSIGVRVPVGFAIVCATDPVTRSLGLTDVHGRISATGGDSLLIYNAGNWIVRAIDGAATVVLACAYSGGASIQGAIRVDGPIDTVPIGAPIRAFHRYTYRLVQDGDEWWLARGDGNRTDVLSGPFLGDGTGLGFVYRDSVGQVTIDPALVSRVELTVAAEGSSASAPDDSLSLSTSIRNN